MTDLGYDLRPCSIGDVEPLVAAYHGYGSVSASATYAFAVFEDEQPVAGYPPGRAVPLPDVLRVLPKSPPKRRVG